jgi:hypothetical protein
MDITKKQVELKRKNKHTDLKAVKFFFNLHATLLRLKQSVFMSCVSWPGCKWRIAFQNPSR